MSVVIGRDTGTDIEELAHPVLLGQVTHSTGQESPVPASEVMCGREATRQDRGHLVAQRPVRRIVGFAAQNIVVHPGRMRPRGVDMTLGSRVGRVCCGVAYHPVASSI